jgi:precorrin-3B synthase
VVHALDERLCASPVFAELPGRFLFAVDDGRGDVAALGADATAVITSAGAVVEGFAVDSAVSGLLAVAEAFLAERAAQGSSAWRMDELEGGRHSALARASLGAWLGPPTEIVAPPPAPSGRIRQLDGRTALVVLAPLGRLTSGQLEWLASCTGTRARVTPWRSVVLPDLDEATGVAATAVAAGLGVEAKSRWYGVSACTGRPGCAKALADVQADAAAAPHTQPGEVVHWSGCERRCGRPHNTTIDIIATNDGYVTHGI